MRQTWIYVFQNSISAYTVVRVEHFHRVRQTNFHIQDPFADATSMREIINTKQTFANESTGGPSVSVLIWRLESSAIQIYCLSDSWLFYAAQTYVKGVNVIVFILHSNFIANWKTSFCKRNADLNVPDGNVSYNE